MSGRPLRVAVVGGSLAGLTAALLLRDAGCEVDVFERSGTPLEGRGVGIVLHPATVRYIQSRAIMDVADVSASASWHRYVDRDGRVVAEVARRHLFTAYDTLYRTLLGAFGQERYRLGHQVSDFEEVGDGIVVTFASAGAGHAGPVDLLVGADGISSTVRRKLMPGVVPRYAGYVAWRAVVEERVLERATLDLLGDSLTYFIGTRSHALAYPIPDLDGSVRPGRRLINLVWYRNAAPGGELDGLLTDRTGRRREVSVPPGMVGDAQLEAVRAEAVRTLPEALAEIAVKAGDLFLQVLFDVAVPTMAAGRACLIGDAAFAVRPHAATATAKGAEDAWALADAIRAGGDDVAGALRAWEPGQLDLGRALLERNRRMGDDVQFHGRWVPGDPELAFGLRAPGDSAQFPA